VKAVGLYRYLPITNPESLLDLELERPVATGRDLLVKVEAISVNPVDVKVRAPKDEVETTPRVLGWDASGVVESVGPQCSLFKPGDHVFYAGSIIRPGTNSEYHPVDERIVGRKPAKLTFAQAAALPLTSITAWESLFDRLGLERNGSSGKSLLIIGASGGVGSIAIQLASQLTRVTVIATASRGESEKWCRDLGADEVIDHTKDLAPQLAQIGFPVVDFIFCCNNTDHYFPIMAQLVAPEGRICSIVETSQAQDIVLLKEKSAAFIWEFMFTRSIYGTADMIEQHNLLNLVADLIDEGKLRTTVGQNLGSIDAANLRRAHGMLENGGTIGKIVLEGF
jgi:NADPH2:quinone reductase